MRARILLCLALLSIFPAQSSHAAAPQMRAFWVDAFHPGIKSAGQTDQLLADAVRAGANTLIVQIRRRGDSYYRDSLEPIATDVAKGYDPLADLITKAHARGIRVHGWTVALPVWKDDYPQPDRNHVWYQHGPGTSDNWFMLRDDGKAGDCGAPNDCGYFLDPGNPGAADYTVNVLTHLISRYDLDGLHLDYIRYPSNRFGYNGASLQRFQQASGRSDRPKPDDAAWMQWRRDQVTKLVKRIYLNMLAQKPRMELSVAAIAWGGGPPNGDFKASSPYVRTLQDWSGWLEAGYIDWALPMIYDKQDGGQQQGWFNDWTDWTKAHPGRRAVGIGLGAWLNDADGNFAQMRRVTDSGSALGTSLYSFAIPVSGDRGAFLDRLHREVWSDNAPAPTLAWKNQPTVGFLLGRLTSGSAAVGNATLRLTGPDGTARWISADGSGVFGDVDLVPGNWTISVKNPQTGADTSQTVAITAGSVAQISLNIAGVTAAERLVPADPDRAFGELWNRTDLPVQSGQTARSWMWGPRSYAVGSEAYREAPGGRRVVQYWDKSRMEVSDPNSDRSQLWFVTNGLLTKELISGKLQTGTDQFAQQQPSDTPVVGDYAVDSRGLTYASFANVASLNADRRSPSQIGAKVIQTIDAAGGTSSDGALARYNVTNATYNNELGHNIPDVFKPYLEGLPLSWVFVMGYPISEPYWTQAKVRGQMVDVLVQMYERRTLSYTPSNPEVFRVEMGNVGQHYFRWRYHDAPWER